MQHVRCWPPSSIFVIDGEAIVLGPDGVSDFAALQSRRDQAQLYAFDMLAGDGEDHRRLPLSMRKANLDGLLSHHVDGTFMADYEQREISHDLFRAAWASKVSSQSIATAGTAVADAGTGSR